MTYFFDNFLTFIFSFMSCYKTAERKRKELCFQLSKFFTINLCLCQCLPEDGQETLLDVLCTSWDLGMCHFIQCFDSKQHLTLTVNMRLDFCLISNDISYMYKIQDPKSKQSLQNSQYAFGL